MEEVPLTRKNRPKIEMDRADLGTKITASRMYRIYYRPTLWERIKRWLRITKPCMDHGRYKFCTGCAPYTED